MLYTKKFANIYEQWVKKSPKEIRELIRVAKLSIEKLITGKFMYIVVLKKTGRG